MTDYTKLGHSMNTTFGSMSHRVYYWIEARWTLGSVEKIGDWRFCFSGKRQAWRWLTYNGHIGD